LYRKNSEKVLTKGEKSKKNLKTKKKLNKTKQNKTKKKKIAQKTRKTLYF